MMIVGKLIDYKRPSDHYLRFQVLLPISLEELKQFRLILSY